MNLLQNERQQVILWIIKLRNVAIQYFVSEVIFSEIGDLTLLADINFLMGTNN